MANEQSQTWNLDHSLSDDQLTFSFSGDWKIENNPPDDKIFFDIFAQNPSSEITLNGEKLTHYDSSFIANLLSLYRQAEKKDVSIKQESIPEPISKLLDLALSTKVRDTQHTPIDSSVFAQVGRFTFGMAKHFGDITGIIGASLQSFSRLFRGFSAFPARDLITLMQSAGPNALAITSLIAFLIGITLAFIGALELQKFGAGIYVADLEMVGMTREMGCLMTGIVMAGRTGAAYAAELGSMTSNEEIDALKTMAIRPMDFLVLPRMLALIFMMPLLVVYANILGNLGGIVVATSMLHLSFMEYITQAREAFTITNLMIGICKGAIFGYLISIAGCLRGIQCQRSAQGVGFAATSAVVTSIVLIITTNAIIDIVLNILGI